MYLPLHDRILSGIAAGLIVALLGAALLFGLKVNPFQRADPEAIATIAVPIAPPPPEPKKPQPKTVKPAHAPNKPSPPNLRNRATPIVAPKPIVVTPVPPVVVAALKPANGAAAQSGAADHAGDGQGAGGNGDGYGGGGGETPPRQRKGKLSFSDLPENLRTPGFYRRVGVIYTVEVDGHADHCRVNASSGIGQLDQLTCSLIEQRFRFDPSRDGAGHKVVSQLIETHTWEIQSQPRDGDDDRDDGRGA